jgi:uracil-DNA glycosylase family 4
MAGVGTLPRVEPPPIGRNDVAPPSATRSPTTVRQPMARELETPSEDSRSSIDAFRPLEAPRLAPEERKTALQVLADEVRHCTACAELAATRNQTVFGVGSATARLCLLGEAPGANEDKQGEPFVGRAGQLLDQILAACTLSRQDVYILNVIKCRPPGNRNPTGEEVVNCRAFFERQIEIIQPEFICCLGSVAAQNLLDTNETIGRLRGKFHDWRGIKVLATYHPAYLLRNPSAKAEVWKDMQFLMQQMGIALPARKSK